jgi:hypothetical protein
MPAWGIALLCFGSGVYSLFMILVGMALQRSATEHAWKVPDGKK